MSIITIEGFKVYDSPKEKSIIINSDCIGECMKIYYKYKLDGVAITTTHDYKLQNIDFLLEYPAIKHLSISDGIKDIEAIHSLANLRTLMVSGKSRKIDFSHFPSLVELIADWSVHFLNMEQCKLLESLSLYMYNPKIKDGSDISNLPWIKKLQIVRGNIQNLRILERFNQLEELYLYYCSKLETLCCLEKSKETLATLIFGNCKSITNHAYASMLQNLKILAYNDGGIISSIKFIDKMPSLKSFRFLGTDVADGDMSPCVGLEYAAFTNKKNFSHTMEQVNKTQKIKS